MYWVKAKSTSEYIRREAKRSKEPSLRTRRRDNKNQEIIRSMREREQFFKDVDDANTRVIDSVDDTND